MGGYSQNKRVIYIIMVGAILFYLPFISRQFMGDDWLWLANAKMASSHPSIFLERPMYGYFRPLNMIIVFDILKLFGPNPYVFSMINILLHACNIWLLWVLLGRFGLTLNERNLSALIFGIYTLNAPAIEWISVGHDLWVTGLSLLFAIFVLRFMEKPRFSLFIFCWLIGFSALLIKESGFVTLGIYFLLFILKGKSPFRKEFVIYSLLLSTTYLLYLCGYFITRTVADREVALGYETILNIWYFLSYLVSPVSRRIATGFPESYLWILKTIKITAAIAVPILLVYIFVKGRSGHRFFILLSIMFISTIAITKWNLAPFDLYPERTVGRFMYSVTPGFAVALAWFIENHIAMRIMRRGYFRYAMVILYIISNFLITYRISQLYFYRQRLVSSIIQSLEILNPALARCQSVVVLTGNMEKTPQIISSGDHLHGMIYVLLDKDITVSVKEYGNYISNQLIEKNDLLTLEWDTANQNFVLPAVNENER